MRDTLTSGVGAGSFFGVGDSPTVEDEVGRSAALKVCELAGSADTARPVLAALGLLPGNPGPLVDVAAGDYVPLREASRATGRGRSSLRLWVDKGELRTDGQGRVSLAAVRALDAARPRVRRGEP